MIVTTIERVMPRSREVKYDERRTQLAISALAAMGELGYARTSLREIAQHSEFSHGVVHYYFKSKAELIIHCVGYYKTTCSHRYDEIVATSTSGHELAARFVDKLVETLRDEAPMHRLWYDMRVQSLFEPEFREQVTAIDDMLEHMTWRIVTKFCELTGAEPTFSPATTYALVDGIFMHALVAYVHGDETALNDLSAQVFSLLPSLFEA